jgi:hypothetical protein
MMLPTEVTAPVEKVKRVDFFKPQKWLGKKVVDGSYARVIDKPVIFQEGGLIADGGAGTPRTTIVLLDLKEYGINLSLLAERLKTINYSALNRVAGTAAVSQALQRVFGYMPRKTGHRDYCTLASIGMEHPEAEHALEEGAKVAEHFYRLTSPDLHAQHAARLRQKRVRKQWRFGEGDSVFTSGIVNKNNPLPYHYDTGNFDQAWSAMFVFKSPGYSGGRLHVPEYDCAFELPDHSLIMFDGQDLIHGVTPVVNEGGAYRYSVVYYSLRMMWKCLTTMEEVDQASVKKWRREKLRARAGRAGGVVVVGEEEEPDDDGMDDGRADERGEGLW